MDSTSPVIIVLLRRPRRDAAERRTDPMYEFGSFGCTGCHRGNLMNPDRIDRSLKTLYATGLFSDVNFKRDGSTLIVTVAENPLINSVSFEGNHKVDDKTLTPLVEERPREVFVYEYAHGDDPERRIWAVWSPTASGRAARPGRLSGDGSAKRRAGGSFDDRR